MVYKNRHQAGEKLAQKLAELKGKKNLIVLAIPRGGLAVGQPISRELDCLLDIVVTKKIGAPRQPELAIGAVDADGEMVLDESLVKAVGASSKYIQKQAKAKQKEIERRLREYRGEKQFDLEAKTVILTDDGIATGATMEVAINWLTRRNPKKIILAVPVASPDSLKKLKNLVDETVCLQAPTFFSAVGQFYRSFPQVTDEEVKEILKETSN